MPGAELTVPRLIGLYLLLMNLAGFASMAIDKRCAVKRRMRIPESTLFIIAIFGGSLGSLLGMWFFSHKTRKTRFAVGIPLILLAQLSVIAGLYLIGIRFTVLE